MTADLIRGKRIFWLIVVAATLRLGLFVTGPLWEIERAQRPDSFQYQELAQNMVHHQSFGRAEDTGYHGKAVGRLRDSNGSRPPKDEHGLYPDAIRTPGYPTVLMLGHLTDYRIVLFLQTLCGIASVWLLTQWIFRLTHSHRGALMAGWLYAIHPAVVSADNILLTESMFNAAFLFGLYQLTRPLTWRICFMAGVGFATATLLRPVGLVFLPAILILTWGNWRQNWAKIALIVLIVLAPVAGWTARNSLRGEGLHYSIVGDWNLLFYQAAYTVAEERQWDWRDHWPKIIEEFEEKLRPRLKPQEDVIAASRRLAWEEISQRPKALARAGVKSMGKLLIDHSASDLLDLWGIPYRPSGIVSRVLLKRPAPGEEFHAKEAIIAGSWLLLNMMILVGTIAGLVRLLRHRQWRFFLLICLILGGFCAGVGLIGSERFRIPMLPWMLLAISWCWRKSDL
ncbi:MAG: hypothetical protein R3B84_11385 [Zavarzinella sp.]